MKKCGACSGTGMQVMISSTLIRRAKYVGCYEFSSLLGSIYM